MNEKILKVVTDFFVIVLKLVMILFLISFSAVSIGEMFVLMGEAWGFFSILWFGIIAIWSYDKHMSDVDNPIALLEGVVAVLLQYLSIAILTFIVCIFSEILRISFSEVIGWSFFVIFNSIIMLSCTDVIHWTKESI